MDTPALQPCPLCGSSTVDPATCLYWRTEPAGYCCVLRRYRCALQPLVTPSPIESTEIFAPFEPLDQNGLTYSNDTELPEVEFREPDPGSIVFSPFPGYEGSGFVVITP
jgi:hypothetical protein